MKILPTLTARLSLATTTFAAEKYTTAMIPKGTTHAFWKSVHSGGLHTVEKRIDTGVVVVRKENIADPANAELLRPPLEMYLR